MVTIIYLAKSLHVHFQSIFLFHFALSKTLSRQVLFFIINKHANCKFGNFQKDYSLFYNE